MITDDAADAIEREAERQLDRRKERRAHDGEERRLAVDRRDHGGGADLHWSEWQLQRAAVSAVVQEAARSEPPPGSPLPPPNGDDIVAAISPIGNGPIAIGGEMARPRRRTSAAR